MPKGAIYAQRAFGSAIYAQRAQRGRRATLCFLPSGDVAHTAPLGAGGLPQRGPLGIYCGLWLYMPKQRGPSGHILSDSLSDKKVGIYCYPQRGLSKGAIYAQRGPKGPLGQKGSKKGSVLFKVKCFQIQSLFLNNYSVQARQTA